MRVGVPLRELEKQSFDDLRFQSFQTAILQLRADLANHTHQLFGVSGGNIADHIVNANLNSLSRKILKDFEFGPDDYAGAFKTGNIQWNIATGVVSGGTGILINKNGIVGALNGAITFSITTAGNATFAGTLSAPSGTLGSITAGTFTGCSINVPNASNPLFSVDKLGNTKVKSLERDDFHWWTNFESIDGYAQAIVGAGTIICNPQSVDFTTGANNGDFNELQKIQPGVNDYFSWDKDRKIKTFVKVDHNTSVSFQIGTGDITNAYFGDNSPRIGFMFLAGKIYGGVADGSGHTEVELTTYSTTAYILLEAKYYAGDRVDFYVNGLLRGTIEDDLPAGTTNAEWYFDAKLFNVGTAGARTAHIVYWDFWQAN